MILRFYAFFFLLCLFYNFRFFNVWKLTSVSMYMYIAIFIVDSYLISFKSTMNKE